MKLKSVHIKNFKRFTDLTVKNIPDTAKLIILAGPNGSGKSSFFDAMMAWHETEIIKSPSEIIRRHNKATRGLSKVRFDWDFQYHQKAGSHSAEDQHQQDWLQQAKNCINLEPFGSVPADPAKAVYVRSAYRNDPEFELFALSRQGNPLDGLSVARMIENDAAVARNYQRLASQALESLFSEEDGSTTVDDFRNKILGDIKQAIAKLLPDLRLDDLGNPVEEGTFRFTKGSSRGFPYMNLSGGEKAAFDLILDLVVARRSYDDTLFCIDEPESHMHTRLQARLLNVLYDLIPDNCQLLLATHSIGMMRRARDIERGNPDTVAFLDFGGRDFDKPEIIEPATPDRAFWEKAYQVALDDLAALVAPERVVICEGEPKTQNPTGNQSHDAHCYNTIFETEFPDTRFVSMGSANEVERDRLGLGVALGILMDGLEVVQLIDRDDRSEEEVEDLRQKGVRVLRRRNIESYLFDDEVLRALADKHGKLGQKTALVDTKSKHMVASQGAADNVKPISGPLYVDCKNLLGLTGCGNTAEAFMRDTLAPLIKPGMAVYEELKHDIFGANDNTPASAENDSVAENP